MGCLKAIIKCWIWLDTVLLQHIKGLPFLTSKTYFYAKIEEGICFLPLGFQIGRSEIDFAIFISHLCISRLHSSPHSRFTKIEKLALWIRMSPSISEIRDETFNVKFMSCNLSHPKKVFRVTFHQFRGKHIKPEPF